MKATRTFSPPRDTVSSGFVTGMIAGLDYRPELRSQLLEHAQIATDRLDAPDTRVSLSSYTALYKAVTEALADEGFGLFSRALRPGFLEWLVRPCISAPDLGEALRRICLHVNLLQDNLHLDLTRPDRTGIVGNDHADELPACLSISVVQPLPTSHAGFIFAHEWLLRLIHGVSSWLVAQPVLNSEVRFPYPPPPHAADYGLIFAPRMRFDATRLELDLASSLLVMPVRREEAALRDFLKSSPANITMLYRREQTLAPRVRQLLRDALPEFLPLARTAKLLALSARSLHRRLDGEGTSYRQLREAVRHELALDSLARSDAPVTRVAADLGFADASSFYRAFSGREGCGPREWRRRHRTQPPQP